MGAGAAAGGGNETMGTVLTQLQQEQARLREDFLRQQALMEKLSKDANTALAERDRARQELDRVRGVLNGGGHAGGGGAGSHGGGPVRLPPLEVELSTSADALDHFVVSTHLVPRDQNNIPSRCVTTQGSQGGGYGQHACGGVLAYLPAWLAACLRACEHSPALLSWRASCVLHTRAPVPLAKHLAHPPLPPPPLPGCRPRLRPTGRERASRSSSTTT